MKLKLLIVIFMLALLTHGCEIDHGLGVLGSKITGKVIFINHDQIPDYVEAVRMAAVVDFDFSDISLSDAVLANTSVNLSREISEYYIPAPLASYELIVAIWKQKGKAWNATNWLGFYGYDPVNQTVEYKSVTLTDQDPVAENINIYCDWSTISPN